jgi:predicted NAD/FAD-binding protein
MSRLQGLKTHEHYCVTLNRAAHIEKSSVLKEFNYTHPSYTLASVATQAGLSGLNGIQNTYFCGSYFGFGFHEDAVKSAVAVGEAMGVSL